MESWVDYIKRGLYKAYKSKDSKQLATQLRHGARRAYKNGEKSLALDLIKLCMDFSEGTNLYILAFKDYHLYKTGERLSNQTPKVQAPEPRSLPPWEKVKQFIEEI